MDISLLYSPEKIALWFNYFIFFALSSIIILSAICVVCLKNIFHCAIFLCLSFIGVAGIYFFIGAEFLAAVQILIYAGGVAVLILFAVMLTERRTEKKYSHLENKLFSFSVSFLIFIILVSSILSAGFSVAAVKKIPQSTNILGKILLSKYFLPFEIASVVLLIAMIGAIIFIRKEDKNE